MNFKFLKCTALIFGILVGLYACKKENKSDVEIEEVKTDAGFYLNAKIDGQAFAADMKSCDCSTPANYLTETYKHNGNLYIRAKKNSANANEGEFWIALGSVSTPYTGAGVYELAPQKGIYAGASYTLNSEKWIVGDEFVDVVNGQPVYSTTTGTVTITKDENKIVEGTFSFSGHNSAKQSTKQITEGKFRLKVK